jgi:hypothetical protein
MSLGPLAPIAKRALRHGSRCCCCRRARGRARACEQGGDGERAKAAKESKARRWKEASAAADDLGVDEKSPKRQRSEAKRMEEQAVEKVPSQGGPLRRVVASSSLTANLCCALQGVQSLTSSNKINGLLATSAGPLSRPKREGRRVGLAKELDLVGPSPNQGL